MPVTSLRSLTASNVLAAESASKDWWSDDKDGVWFCPDCVDGAVRKFTRSDGKSRADARASIAAERERAEAEKLQRKEKREAKKRKREEAQPGPRWFEQ